MLALGAAAALARDARAALLRCVLLLLSHLMRLCTLTQPSRPFASVCKYR